jgi:hypothetical protein
MYWLINRGRGRGELTILLKLASWFQKVRSKIQIHRQDLLQGKKIKDKRYTFQKCERLHCTPEDDVIN